MRKRLLVVASEVGLRAAIARCLVPAGFAIELAEGAKKAREVLATGDIAAGIVRIESRDAAVLSIARRLNQSGGQLIVVVDHVEEIGRLTRLGVGVDAYLTRPLTEEAVLDRVNAVFRQIAGREEARGKTEIIHFDGMTLDLASHSLVGPKGREVQLTRAEFALLAILASRPRQVLSRDRLLDAVSGRRADVFDRSIDNLIVRLRRKIENQAKRPRLIITVPGAGYKFLPGPHAGVASSPSHSAARRPWILVLPFANLSGCAELSHFVASLSIILTSGLRHVVGAQVLRRHHNIADALENGRQLGVRYIVSGSVRRSADRIRVNAQMTDPKTGASIWADYFDGNLSDLFTFESEVTARISRAIDLELVEFASRRSQDRAGNPNVLDFVTRGYAFLYRPRSAGNLAMARGSFEQALRLDERNAEALAGLAHTHISDTLGRWSADPEAQVRLANASVARAIEINPNLAYAYHVRGLVLRVQQQHERAIVAFERAVQINPSLAPAHAEIGFMKDVLNGNEGGPTHSLDALALARRISPRDPALANWLYGIGIAHLKIGDDTQAIRWLNESIGLNPLPPALAYLAAAYALNGDDMRARSALNEFRRMQPNETLQAFGQRVFADHWILPGSRVFEGLRKAGLRKQ
jgi:DNA-binding response OmpR family regulator/TolB-like protein